jgi:hypothetical protein
VTRGKVSKTWSRRLLVPPCYCFMKLQHFAIPFFPFRLHEQPPHLLTSTLVASTWFRAYKTTRSAQLCLSGHLCCVMGNNNFVMYHEMNHWKQQHWKTNFTDKGLFIVLTREPAKLIEWSVAGVCNLQPVGRIWPSQPFYWVRHIIWEVIYTRKTDFFANKDSTDINVCTLPNRNVHTLIAKIILMVQIKVISCRLITVKLSYCSRYVIHLFKQPGI